MNPTMNTTSPAHSVTTVMDAIIEALTTSERYCLIERNGELYIETRMQRQDAEARTAA